MHSELVLLPLVSVSMGTWLLPLLVGVLKLMCKTAKLGRLAELDLLVGYTKHHMSKSVVGE
jgi:hypothetical protein